MVLGILVVVIAAPGLLGSQEAIRQSQSKEKRGVHLARRCNLIATCVKVKRSLTLRTNCCGSTREPATARLTATPYGHAFAGYYLPYPDTSYEGLVTTVTDEAPIFNWVYIDKDTYEVKYGVRLDAQPNLTGPFDCTRQDRRLAFEGREGDDDGLRGKVAKGVRVLDVELTRREKRWRKDERGPGEAGRSDDEEGGRDR
ncbi:uncharacterized protein EI97DRAFT_453578 [Westerdykella ornata]|uniref:Uncharacterized protein n=1 Tax=Westerdykella ornata TaxID=318751 RepID=A0A6A6J552_WESOR|nr:uncharacterized protein EI97DRAFT_453578 [Westerdykella ornata]KAF2271575.1 hypothetical protein EI97DRAFT_453578 [Westerdykella ornata]